MLHQKIVWFFFLEWFDPVGRACESKSKSIIFSMSWPILRGTKYRKLHGRESGTKKETLKDTGKTKISVLKYRQLMKV